MEGKQQLIEEINPMPNDRTEFIQNSLKNGKSRQEIASILGYKTWRSLDIYMRRQGMKWDSKRHVYYYPKTDKSCINELINTASSKIALIISLFKENSLDPMQIAQKAGFENHRQLASYMYEHGYVWSSALKNYVKKNVKNQKYEMSEEKNPIRYTKVLNNSDDLEKYIPFFEVLLRNRDKLLNLLHPSSPPGTIPRYVIPGITRTKSFYMSDRLSKLISQFSSMNNISQREIIEAAVIEFLRNHNFAKEVDAMLGQEHML